MQAKKESNVASCAKHHFQAEDKFNQRKNIFWREYRTHFSKQLNFVHFSFSCLFTFSRFSCLFTFSSIQLFVYILQIQLFFSFNSGFSLISAVCLHFSDFSCLFTFFQFSSLFTILGFVPKIPFCHNVAQRLEKQGLSLLLRRIFWIFEFMEKKLLTFHTQDKRAARPQKIEFSL